jgi:GNAT superfamily N-acetyltransferase
MSRFAGGGTKHRSVQPWPRAFVVVAEDGGQLVGVGQGGRRGADHVVYKLYVHPHHRGRGLGRQPLDALIKRLPVDADRLYIEHFVANEHAGKFYEREGFTVERIEPSPTDDAAIGGVWRRRNLAPFEPKPPTGGTLVE